MGKKVAVINDLSGFGRCSLTAAISVISAMGVQPCPLPTAILSAQTGYASYYYDDYTDKMDCFRREWEKMNAAFDGIYTGFMSGCRQIGKTLEFLDSFKKEKTFLLVDPIMGDHGKRFDIFTEEFQEKMKELVSRADIITPNITELCLLADVDERRIPELAGETGLMGEKQAAEAAEDISRRVMKHGPSEVVVTGIRFRDGESGEEMMGNLAVTKAGVRFFSQRQIGGSYSGTGDLFASVITGGRARGDSLKDLAALAGRFIGLAAQEAVRQQVPRNEGVEYEKYLPILASAVPGIKEN